MSKLIKESATLFGMTILLAALACMLSCKSSESVSSAAHKHESVKSDTLASIVYSEHEDSTFYYHGVIDSLKRDLERTRKEFRELQTKDSTMQNSIKKDSVHVRDSVWTSVGSDGSVTHHKYTEKNTFSFQALETYRKQIMKESNFTIDSLRESNMMYKEMVDSLVTLGMQLDSLSFYRNFHDSIFRSSQSDIQKTIVKGLTWWDKFQKHVGCIAFLIIIGSMCLAVAKDGSNK